MIKPSILNRRMKDFYGTWLLSRQFDFTGTRPGGAIRQAIMETSMPPYFKRHF